MRRDVVVVGTSAGGVEALQTLVEVSVQNCPLRSWLSSIAMLDDGTARLAAIRESGGVVVVQDSEDALFPDMPSHAIEHVAVNHVAVTKNVGHLLDKLCAEDVEAAERLPSSLMESKRDSR